MRRYLFTTACFLCVCFVVGCAEPMYVRVEQRPSFAETSTKSDRYQRKAAIWLQPGSLQTPAMRESEQLFLQDLVDAVHHNARNLHLTATTYGQTPEFMQSEHDQDFFALTRRACVQGYQNFLVASVLNIQPSEEKTGIWWFRKMRYFLTLTVRLDAYDTFTAAKIFSHVQEETISIKPDEYQFYQSASNGNLPVATKTLAAMAEAMGKRSTREIMIRPWISMVAAVQGEQVTLAAGREDGLKKGDRFTVIEARRVMTSQSGEKFIVPGYKTGTIHLTEVDERRSLADADGPADIQTGDMVLPLK